MTEVCKELEAWVKTQLLAKGWQVGGDGLQPLCGDAGFRRYFRVPVAPSLIAVYSPPATEANQTFVNLARHLRNEGIHTPEILAFDADRGYLLLEDLGTVHLLDQLSDVSVDALYAEAMMVLLRLQQASLAVPAVAQADGQALMPLPVYDRALLSGEMQLLQTWFIPQLLGYQLTEHEQSMLSEVFATLEESALDQPQVLVHRDYHSRNLMLRDGEAPGVIDFQDAVRGPLTYDLVSLLRDCYVRWPAERVERWAVTYADMLVDVGIMAPVCEHTFMRWFDLMGLQRHIKVLGIFARLYLRDGKSGYLKDLPLVIRYVMEVSRKYPEFGAFSAWFEDKLLPLAESATWYSDWRCAGDVPAALSPGAAQ